jgi:hypothetical protein
MPEKDDMRTSQWCSNDESSVACIDVARPNPAPKISLVADAEQRTQPLSRKELRLRCVSSGYLTGGCSCPRRIPAHAVLAAWRRELENAPGERFFHFAWGGGEWLAYGLEDGLVRGVYCPDHSAERDERSFSYGSRANAASDEFAVGA